MNSFNVFIVVRLYAFKFDKVYRFDLTGDKVELDCGLKVGMTIDEVLNRYGERKVYDLTKTYTDNDFSDIEHLLTSYKPEGLYSGYEKAMYITADYQKYNYDIIAMGLVLLINDNQVERIVYGHPTAD